MPRVTIDENKSSGMVGKNTSRASNIGSSVRFDTTKATSIEQDVEIRYWDDGITKWDETGIKWDIWYSSDGDVQTNDYPRASVNKEKIRND